MNIYIWKCVYCISSCYNNSYQKYFKALQCTDMRRKLLSFSVLWHTHTHTKSGHVFFYCYKLKTRKQCAGRWASWRGGGRCLSFMPPVDAWFSCVEGLWGILFVGTSVTHLELNHPRDTCVYKRKEIDLKVSPELTWREKIVHLFYVLELSLTFIQHFCLGDTDNA